MKELTFEADESGERLDVCLAQKAELTRTRIQQLIKEGNIQVNKKNEKPSYKVQAGDIIDIIIPDEKEIELVPEEIPLDILYQDKDIAVINKQADFVVHPAAGHESGTLVNAVMFHIRDLSGINGEIRPGIVHRLDKDTSGVLLIAKNDLVHTKLSEMFKNKDVKKIYLAIVKGEVGKDSGKISTLIGRDTKDRKKMAVVSRNGKAAVTNFEVLERKNGFSLLKVNIETGRTHQIRVHMKYIGHPILGDKVYGKPSKLAERQMLHAYRLEFEHPVSGVKMVMSAELPDDFKNVTEKLGFENLASWDL